MKEIIFTMHEGGPFSDPKALNRGYSSGSNALDSRGLRSIVSGAFLFNSWCTFQGSRVLYRPRTPRPFLITQAPSPPPQLCHLVGRAPGTPCFRPHSSRFRRENISEHTLPLVSRSRRPQRMPPLYGSGGKKKGKSVLRENTAVEPILFDGQESATHRVRILVPSKYRLQKEMCRVSKISPGEHTAENRK